MASDDAQPDNLDILNDIQFVSEKKDKKAEIKRKCLFYHHQGVEIMKTDIIEKQEVEEQLRNDVYKLEKERRELFNQAIEVLDVELTEGVKSITENDELGEVRIFAITFKLQYYVSTSMHYFAGFNPQLKQLFSRFTKYSKRRSSNQQFT
jgi:small-conductance mechanosensitive channel